MLNNFNYSVGGNNYPPKKKNTVTTFSAQNNFDALKTPMMSANGDIQITIPTVEFDHTNIYTEPKALRWDITGKRYYTNPNSSVHEQNQSILGEDYVYNTGINLTNSLIQGATITLTGGGSAAVAGTLARRQLIADVSLLAVKGVSQAIQYHEVGSDGHTYGWGKSFAMGFGGQVKFGNLGLFQKTFKKDGILYDLAHTSHEWHHWSEHASYQLLSISPTKPYSLFNAQVQLNSLYTDFGFAQLEKQWLSGAALYKGNFGQSSYWYNVRNGGGHNAATSGPLEHGEKGNEHKQQNEHQTNIEHHASAESTWVDKVTKAVTVDDPDRNFIGKTVDIWRATEGYFNDAIIQNQTYKAQINDYAYNQIVNGNWQEKIKGVVGIPGLIVENLAYSSANVVDFGLGTLFGAVDVLVSGFGDFSNVAYVSAQNWLDSGTPSAKSNILFEDITTVNNANGTTTITIKSKPKPTSEQSDIQRKQNEKLRQIKNAEQQKKKKEDEARLAAYKGNIQSSIASNQRARNMAIYGTRGANMPIDYNKDPIYKSVFGATPGSAGSMKLPVANSFSKGNTISTNYGRY